MTTKQRAETPKNRQFFVKFQNMSWIPRTYFNCLSGIVDNHLNPLIIMVVMYLIESKNLFKVKFYFWEYFNNFEVL
jgi:hypothetical protein